MKKQIYVTILMVIALVNSNAFAQVQGNVFFNDNNVVQTLQKDWNMPLNQAAGNHLKIELWQVNYVADKKDHNITNILLQRKLNANTAFQAVQNGLHFTVQNVPNDRNLALIVYASNIASGDNVKVTGRPNDGMPASLTHQFKSDAKKHLGNNIVYGIFSLQPQNAGSADFKFSTPGATQGCKNCFDLGDAWNAVSDAVSDAADAVGKFVKAAVDATGETVKNLGESIVVNNGIFGVECFGVITTFLQSGQTPKARMLSDYGNAYAIANNTIFMGALPPISRIIVTNLMSIDRRPFTVPIKTGNDVFILMNLGDAFGDPLNSAFNGIKGDVFIHELTHAWQIWNIDNLRLFVDGAVNQFKNTVISNQYKYSCTGHNISDSYNEEQQAMIVENFYSMLYFRPDVKMCDFEQLWTVQNILHNKPAGINDLFTATRQIVLQSHDGLAKKLTGATAERTLAFHSNGNRMDGDGFFLPGNTNNAFYYFSNKTRTVSYNWGVIRDKYTKANYEFGELGWPENSEVLLPDGVGYFQKFNHGFIYWGPKTGAYLVMNNIFEPWKSQGWEKGKLGYPISDFIAENSAAPVNTNFPHEFKGYQKFEGGVIFYTRMIGGIKGIQESTSIDYGNPDIVLARHREMKTQVQPAQLNVNTIGQENKSTNKLKNSELNKKAINPQPLPPKVNQ